MKKLLIIPAILATAFTAVAAVADQPIVSASQEVETAVVETRREEKKDDVFFVGQKELKISAECAFEFSNMIGYKSITDAEQEKNGQVIGIACVLKSESKNITKIYRLYKKECVQENWIVVSSFLPKPILRLLTPEDLEYNTTIERVMSGNNGFDRNMCKGVQCDFDSQLRVILHMVPQKIYTCYGVPFYYVENKVKYVASIKEWAKNLSNKSSYSDAEKIAIYIAVKAIVDANEFV
jgi:hypothetical protein